MKKLFRNKKGFNDVFIIAGILALIFFTSAMIEFLNDEFDTGGQQLNIDGTLAQINQDAENESKISAFNILFTALKLSFWDKGNSLGLPWWIDLAYTLALIILVFTIARNIWIGGGG